MRARLGLVALLFALAALAWWSTADRMAGMDAGPGTDLGALGWFLGVVGRDDGRDDVPVGRADGRALRADDAASAALDRAAAVHGRLPARLGRGGRGRLRPLRARPARCSARDLAWHSGGRWFAGGVLAVAALYELTPLKDVCLAKCRSPLGFLLGALARRRRGAR